MTMIILILVVIGVCLGSFVNALVWRIHDQAEINDKLERGKKLTKADKARLEKLSITKGHSMCLHCGHELAVRDLVPVISWLWLRGKCRYCKAPIPDTPLAELAVPVLFILSYLWWPYALDSGFAVAAFVVWLACLVCFVALTMYDARWFILPNRIVFPLIVLAMAQTLLLALAAPHFLPVIRDALEGMLIIAGLFYGLFVVSNEQWIGGGDVKLAIALGLLAGGAFEALELILFASITGLLVSLPVLVVTKSKNTKIPFGPYLLVGAFIVVLFGARITNWYLGLLTV
jgi:prepilin signal peptidase PulO-like enzyme (type II secretory pathway)